jgi:hypothetical protein
MISANPVLYFGIFLLKIHLAFEKIKNEHVDKNQLILLESVDEYREQ